MSWLEKVKKYVNEFENNCDYDEYFVIIPKEEVDGIAAWLADYVSNKENGWLWYDFREIANASEYDLLRLSI